MALGDLLASLGAGAATTPVARVWKCAQCRAGAQEGAKLCAVCRDEECLARQRAHLRHAWASLPDRFRGAVDWTWDAQRRLVLSASVGRPVTLLGPPGTGKTALACALLGAWIRRGEARGATWGDVQEAASARYATDAQLCAAAAAHPLGQGDAPLVRAALRASLLVLDELGSDLAGRKTARDVLFARYDEGNPTVITTGQSRADVEKYWGGGAVRRIWTQAYEVDLAKLSKMEVVR